MPPPNDSGSTVDSDVEPNLWVKLDGELEISSQADAIKVPLGTG